jgi:ubiquinol-cytochrome c reductase cytochrome b subunit
VATRSRSRPRRPGVVYRVGHWVDERVGAAHFARTALDKIFPDHWSFMLGEIALYCFVVLVLTGIYLTFFFSASTQDVVYHGSYGPLRGVHMSEAYHSTIRLSFDVRAGLVFRQIHHWAALIFIAAIVTHLCRIFFTGAFRRPRELNWIVGVSLLLLAIANGFTGYSLPDDLLSGTGLRIAYSIVLGIPFLGTWLAFLFFGGEFPAAALEGRLFVLHVMLVPALIIVLLTAHLAILWRQKHTQFRGPGRTERNVVGSFLWPTYTLRSIGLFAGVAALLSALGGLAQINPVWLYGPFKAASVSTAAQPDWYVGWLEGALRLAGPWRVHIFGYTISEVFWPGILLPGITFGLLFLWPFVEARFTGDHLEHHLLDSPRERPMRTAIGVGVLTFYIVLVVAGAQDIVAQKTRLGIPTVTNTLRVLLVVLPALLAFFTWRTCHDLQQKGAREDDYPRPYPKARTPYQVTDQPALAVPGTRPSDSQPSRSAPYRALSAAGAAAAAAGGFLIGRRRPKKIVFEETRKK